MGAQRRYTPYPAPFRDIRALRLRAVTPTPPEQRNYFNAGDMLGIAPSNPFSGQQLNPYGQRSYINGIIAPRYVDPTLLL